MIQPTFVKTLATLQSICIERQRSAFVQVCFVLCDVNTLQYEIMFYKAFPKFVIYIMCINM